MKDSMYAMVKRLQEIRKEQQDLEKEYIQITNKLWDMIPKVNHPEKEGKVR